MLVLHFDGAGSVSGLLRRVCRDRGDHIALEATNGIEQRGFDPIGPTPFEVRRRGAVADHRPDPGHLFRAAGINALDPGMRIGTAHHGAMDHARQRQVGGVDCRAADPLVAIHPGPRFADDVGLPPGRGFGVRRRRFRYGNIFSIIKVLLVVAHSWLPLHGSWVLDKDQAFLFCAAVSTASKI